MTPEERIANFHEALKADNQIWYDIPGLRGRYVITKCGRVKRLRFKKRIFFKGNYTLFSRREMDLKAKDKGNGYLYVSINNKSVAVHRLLAITFLPNPHKKAHVNHIDSNKTNNSLDNLEWATPQENAIHCVKANRNKPSRKLTADQVVEIRNSDRSISSAKMAQRYGVCSSVIRHVRQGISYKSFSI